MISKIKNLLVLISAKDIVYLFVILCLVVFLLRGCTKKDPNIEIKKPVPLVTEQKVDKKGTPYTEIKGTIYTQDQMDHVTDSFRKVLGKGKVVQVIQTITLPIHDTIKVGVRVDTSTHILRASDSTKYYKQTFTGNWQTKNGEFTLYLVPDTATYVTTWKNRLFRRDVLTANVYHTDSLFTPVMGNVYTAKAPVAIIDFDLFTGYDLLHRQPCIAIGAGLHIFSIKKKN